MQTKNIIILIVIIYIFLKISRSERYTNNMLNIYNEELQPCGDNTMNRGSWDNEGKCVNLVEVFIKFV